MPEIVLNVTVDDRPAVLKFDLKEFLEAVNNPASRSKIIEDSLKERSDATPGQ